MTSTQTLSYVADAGEHGHFSLSVHIRAGATVACGLLRDIMALHGLEHLTRSLEDTVDQPLNWRSVQSPQLATEMLELTLQFTDESVLFSANVMLPISILPKLASLKVGGIDNLRDSFWKPVSSTLRLSTLQLSTDEQVDLGEGALVIIPESYENTWNTILHIGNGALCLQGEYLWPDDSWLQQAAGAAHQATSTSGVDVIEAEPTEASASKDDSQRYHVQFECHLDPVALMNFEKPVSPGLQKILSNESSDSTLWLQNNGGDRFRGQLLALGSGQALLLQKHEPAVL